MAFFRWSILCALLSASCSTEPNTPELTSDTSASPSAPVGVSQPEAARVSPEVPAPEPPTTANERAVPRLRSGEAFFGDPDAPHLRALATGQIVEIEKGRGGRSLAFKLTLDDGTVGYFKPEQTFSAAHWYAEVASFHLDRALGIGRVPAVVARRLPWAALRAVAEDDARLHEVIVGEDGSVRGAFVAWIDGGLARLQPGRSWERWLRMDGPLALTPFVRPRQFRIARDNPDLDALDRGRDDDDRTGSSANDGEDIALREPDTLDRPAELSDLILFDYLTANVDRWGGNFTNVRTLGARPGGPLVYLDNGAGFAPGRQRFALIDARLTAVQRFRRSTVDAIRALDLDAYHERLTEDPLGPFLDEGQRDGLAQRRAALLEHVDATVARFGDAAFFPESGRL